MNVRAVQNSPRHTFTSIRVTVPSNSHNHPRVHPERFKRLLPLTLHSSSPSTVSLLLHQTSKDFSPPFPVPASCAPYASLSPAMGAAKPGESQPCKHVFSAWQSESASAGVFREGQTTESRPGGLPVHRRPRARRIYYTSPFNSRKLT